MDHSHVNPRRRSRSSRPRDCRSARAGFTLIELVMVLGVVMILLSFAAPAIGRSMATARQTRDAGQLRQNFTLVSQYVHEHRDVYPVAHENAPLAGWEWYRALHAGGYFSTPGDADPYGYRAYRNIRYVMSWCLMYDPDRMLPGRTVPPEQATSRAVRQHMVSYPSHKGAMVQERGAGGYYPADPHAFCCTMRWKAPVVFCDSSLIIADHIELNAGEPAVVVDLVGMPVISTWGGYLGRDR